MFRVSLISRFPSGWDRDRKEPTGRKTEVLCILAQRPGWLFTESEVTHMHGVFKESPFKAIRMMGN